ncbi:unnamed protein product [Closterium sp. NIES-65]|nr:unnamed protein product [Closterium sp. NIES-65]
MQPRLPRISAITSQHCTPLGLSREGPHLPHPTALHSRPTESPLHTTLTQPGGIAFALPGLSSPNFSRVLLLEIPTVARISLPAAMATAMASSLSLGLSSLSLAPTAAIDGPSTARPLSFSASSLRGSALSLSASAPRQRAEAAFVCKAAYADVEGDQEESEEDIRAGYEALYGKPFGVVKDSKSFTSSDEDDEEAPARRQRRGPRTGGDSDNSSEGGSGGGRGGRRGLQASDGMSERVLQVRRVTKVVKGGKQLSFRAVVVVGDRGGQVGVGVGKAKEVSTAVQKAVKDARRHMVRVPMTKYRTFPHRSDGNFGAAAVMLRPAATGTGVIAGGAVRVVLELAGLENALGKSLGSPNPLNNARAVLDAVSKMKQFKEVSEERNIPMEVLWQ